MRAGSTPASSTTIFANSAYWSRVNSAGRLGRRSAGNSAMPTMAASPRSPLTTAPRVEVAPRLLFRISTVSSRTRRY